MRRTARILGVLAFGSALLAPQMEAQRAGRPERPARPSESRAERAVPARGWLGISFRSKETESGSLVVDEVFRASPAQRAGIQRGDTIVLWNGRRDVIAGAREPGLQPGDTVRVRVRRGGERDHEIAVVASDRPARMYEIRRGPRGEVSNFGPLGLGRELRVLSDSLAVHADSLHRRLQVMLRDSLGPRLREMEQLHLPEMRARLRELEGRLPRMEGERVVLDLGRRAVAGAEFAEVNEGLASYFGTDRGALVLKVAPDTPAARAGLQAGDVLVEVNDQPIASVADVRRAVARAQERDPRTVEITVLRKGQRKEVEMRWE